ELSDQSRELLALRLVDDVFVILTSNATIGGDGYHVELVSGVELLCFGERRTRHARQLLVDAEQVLERDARHRTALFLDPYVLLRFYGLVQTVAPPTTGEYTTGELVDDQDLVVRRHH